MLKKMISLMLSLCLCACIIPCPSLAEETGALESASLPFTYVDAIARMGNQALIYTSDGFFTSPDGQSWTPLSLSGLSNAEELYVSRLAASDDMACFLYSDWSEYGQNYILYQMDAAGSVRKVCDLVLTTDPNVFLMIDGMAMLGNDVYLAVQNSMSTAYGHTNLYKVSLADGSVADMGEQPIMSLSPYKDGTLLVSSYMESNVSIPSICVFDPATQKLSHLYQMKDYTCGAIAWDKDTDIVYYADASCLYRLLNGAKESEICAYLTPGYGHSDDTAFALNGLYYISSYDATTHMDIATTDPSLLPSRTLRLAVNFANDIVRDYSAAHRDVAVQVMESGWDVETITQQMITSSDAADIFSLSLESGLFSILRDKGYCYELTLSQTLIDFVSPMYEHLTREFWKDGKLYALPVEMNCYCSLAYYPAVLEDLGLTEDDLPHTWSEMLDFCARWNTEIGPDCDDEYKLLDNDYDLFQSFFSYLLQCAITQSEAKGETMKLNTPAILSTLKKLQEMKPLLNSMSSSTDDMIGSTVVFSSSGNNMPNSLFSTYCDLMPGGYHGYANYSIKPLILTTAAEDTPALSSSISLYIINPNSQNKDLAIDFLEYVSAHMEKDHLIALNPSVNEPVENRYYQRNLQEYEKVIAELQKAYDEAADEDKRTYKEALDDMLEYQKDYEQNDRWDITLEDVETYRTYAPNLVCAVSPWATGNMDDLSSLLRRFIDGQLGAEQFVREFDRVIMMMEMENQ